MRRSMSTQRRLATLEVGLPRWMTHGLRSERQGVTYIGVWNGATMRADEFARCYPGRPVIGWDDLTDAELNAIIDTGPPEVKARLDAMSEAELEALAWEGVE
jgi:hypothetical protein